MTKLSINLDEETDRTLKFFGFIDSEGRVNKGVKLSSYICKLIRINLLQDLEMNKAKREWTLKRIEYFKEEINQLKSSVAGMGESLRKKGKL